MAGAVVLAVIGLVVVGLSAGVASGQPPLTPTPPPAPPTSVPTPQFPFFPAPAPITPTPTVTPTPSPPPIYADIFVPPSPPILSVTPDSPVPVGTVSTLTATGMAWPYPGSVQFLDDGASIGPAVPVTAYGAASVTRTLPPGSHTLGAVFNGQCPSNPEQNFYLGCLGGTMSSASPVTYVVIAPTPAPTGQATTSILRVFPTPAFEGFPAVLLANVAPRRAAGTVQFFDGSTPLGAPIPVTGGFALLITPLPQGAHSLTAVFTPTNAAAYTPSTSPPVSRTVNPLVRLR